MSEAEISKTAQSLQHEISQRLLGLNNGFVFFERKDIERSLPDRFEKQVAKYPQRIAVKSPPSDAVR